MNPYPRAMDAQATRRRREVPRAREPVPDARARAQPAADHDRAHLGDAARGVPRVPAVDRRRGRRGRRGGRAHAAAQRGARRSGPRARARRTGGRHRERRPPRARRGRQPTVGRPLRPALDRRDRPGAEGVGGPGRVRAHTSDPCPWIVRLAPAGRAAGPPPDRSLERGLRRRSAPARTGRAIAAALAARRQLRRGRRRGVLVVGGRRTPSLDDRVLDVPAGSADRAGLHPARASAVAGSPRTWWRPRARR